MPQPFGVTGVIGGEVDEEPLDRRCLDALQSVLVGRLEVVDGSQRTDVLDHDAEALLDEAVQLEEYSGREDAHHVGRLQGHLVQVQRAEHHLQR